ncbi:HAD-IC family P-type ATPase [Aliidiomarina halalkaliphila]|uniref:HAD-IC family P-type ATPase n=1 Tax=Aliidiomarina halalkaliphila TaxID=2593535 RepID=A0A552X4J2_9GAMM|nr:HAD-IC family P-type ATPase [Aliidiomarina halalkaliphila]TRW49942.1 HAD-IC family P-type ATPase [Aliidiomarina halalkaliphila]
MDQQPLEQPCSYAQSTSQVLDTLGVDVKQGLSDSDVAKRQAQYGLNSLPEKSIAPWWQRLLRQFHNVLIYVLLVAAGLAALLTEWLDMAVILAVVVVNAVIGFVQEGKAERALQAIQNMLSPEAHVIRHGKRTTIPAQALVPGDIVLLEAGQKIPADIRLLENASLQAQEAALTGESVPISKHTDALDEATPLAERKCMLYAGTLVTHGQGRGVVTATGAHTELGRINQMLKQVVTIETPLLRQMAIFARYLTYVILALGAILFVLGWWRGYELTYLFMAVVSLVVAAIPEGLPTILTVALAMGVMRMASRHAIIRRLPAVETLGAVSVICSDKTGTLTRNEMMVAQVRTANALYQVEGVGYAAHGEIHPNGANDTDLSWLLKVALLCNDSEIKAQGDERIVLGDPMEGALLVLAEKADQGIRTEANELVRAETLPFDSRHKYMATQHRGPDGQSYVLVKGAPERLLQLCGADQATWTSYIDAVAAEGQRVLGFAYKAVQDNETLNHESLSAGLTFLGITGLIDPPREEAIKAVADCQRAGITVQMITGDHAATASAIGKALGIIGAENVLTGAELEQLSDEELAASVQNVAIYARTTPEHKLRLVSALQSHNKVVAMTGDGVNDAPALKRADIGIAMGKGGTDAAREASEMVLTDDNFASIVAAVKEGRTVYDNLKKAISFLLPVNGGESLAIMIALIFALTLPILPLQILWVNMVSSIVLALALAFEASERDIMRRPPRLSSEPLLSRFLLWRILFVSLLFTTGIFAVFQWALAQGLGEAYARTMAVNTLVAMEVWYLFSVRYLRRGSFFKEGIQGTRPVLIAVSLVFVLQLIFTYAAPMQAWFNTASLSITHGFICAGIGIVLFVVLEGEKLLRRFFTQQRLHKNQV